MSSGAEIALFWGLINNENVGHTTTSGLINLIPPIIFLIFTFVCFGRKKYIDQFGLFKKNMFSAEGLKISYQAGIDGATLLIKDLLLTLQNQLV